VRGDVLAVHYERRLSVPHAPALRVPEVPEDLVVGAVLLDDVEDVLDRAGLPHAVRDDAVAGDGRAVQGFRGIGAVPADLFRVAGQLLRRGAADEGDDAVQAARDVVEPGPSLQPAGLGPLRRVVRLGAQSLTVG